MCLQRRCIQNMSPLWRRLVEALHTTPYGRFCDTLLPTERANHGCTLYENSNLTRSHRKATTTHRYRTYIRTMDIL